MELDFLIQLAGRDNSGDKPTSENAPRFTLDELIRELDSSIQAKREVREAISKLFARTGFSTE